MDSSLLNYTYVYILSYAVFIFIYMYYTNKKYKAVEKKAVENISTLLNKLDEFENIIESNEVNKMDEDIKKLATYMKRLIDELRDDITGRLDDIQETLTEEEEDIELDTDIEEDIFDVEKNKSKYDGDRSLIEEELPEPEEPKKKGGLFKKKAKK